MFSEYKHEAYHYGEASSENLTKAQFIHLPKEKFQYIGIDLDWPGSASLWMNEGYPKPTITIISPKTSHSKYFYELTYPVNLPSNWMNEKKCLKQYSFYRDVKAGLTRAMGGDKGYSGTSMNNPFYRNALKEVIHTENGQIEHVWKVHWSDKTYTLGYLSEFIKRQKHDYRHDSCVDVTSRAITMFHLTRVDAYKMIHSQASYEEFYDSVVAAAKSHWMYLRTITKDHPLEEAEAENIAYSVTNWVWAHQGSPWLKKFGWNLGALNFSSINREEMTPEQVKQEVLTRQSFGAKYVHEKRRRETESKISRACSELMNGNEKLTLKNISKNTNLSMKTLNRYKEYISNQFNDHS